MENIRQRIIGALAGSEFRHARLLLATFSRTIRAMKRKLRLLFRVVFRWMTKEFMMPKSSPAPRLTRNGVTFTVTVEFKDYKCLVPQDTLIKLCKSQDPQLDLIATYRAYEGKIRGVARRLIAAGVAGTPMRLESKYF